MITCRCMEVVVAWATASTPNQNPITSNLRILSPARLHVSHIQFAGSVSCIVLLSVVQADCLFIILPFIAHHLPSRMAIATCVLFICNMHCCNRFACRRANPRRLIPKQKLHLSWKLHMYEWEHNRIPITTAISISAAIAMQILFEGRLVRNPSINAHILQQPLSDLIFRLAPP